MKIKSLLASAAACAIAISAMAISASADALYTQKNGDATNKYVIDFSGIDGNAVDKITASFTLDGTDYMNGIIGYNDNGEWVGSEATKQELSANGDFVVSGLAGHLGAEPYAEVQTWWVNEGGSVSLVSVTLYDASGAVLKSFGEAADAPAAETTTSAAAADGNGTTTSSSSTTTTTTTTTTTAASGSNTGDAGVAVAVAGLAIAGAAAFVARKKD